MPALADTVHEFDPITREGNGFVFESFAARERAAHGRVPTPESVRDTF